MQRADTLPGELDKGTEAQGASYVGSGCLTFTTFWSSRKIAMAMVPRARQPTTNRGAK
jgi:hypothetical protein